MREPLLDMTWFSHCNISCMRLQDEYSRLSRNASLGVHGYALVFSIVSRQSFELIRHVNDSLLNTLGDAPDVPRVLVGSMSDLSSQRQINYQVRE
jgi:Ras homolog enriched in brain